MGDRAINPVAATAAILLICFILLGALLSGCGGSPSQEEKISEVIDTAAAFLDACGNLEAEAVRSYFSQDYLESNQIPESITPDDIIAAMGQMNSYRLSPDRDINVEGDRAVVSVVMDIKGKGEREETIILRLEDGEWRVDGFTAMDWTTRRADGREKRADIEEALRDFLIACIDQDTDYIYEHLSEDYLDKYRLEEPWTPAEFSGIFGTARSFNFDPNQIAIEDGTAEVDVTVEFGSRGNLESETSKVRLINDGSEWLIDTFPFFIY